MILQDVRHHYFGLYDILIPFCDFASETALFQSLETKKGRPEGGLSLSWLINTETSSILTFG